jgi:ribosomal protein L11 methyltransferase
MNWLEVSLTVNGELAEAVADVLARFAPNGVAAEQSVAFRDEEDQGVGEGPITVRAYLRVDEQLETTRRRLDEALYYLGRIQPLPLPRFMPVADQNWMEVWKQHYRPIQIGERLIVVPAWLDATDPNRIPIRIDPGMAFGTGTHPSTQLCLELIEEEVGDRVQRNEAPETPLTFIDVGCGSAILSIAALKLGAASALGVDIDVDSIRNARENAAANGIGDKLMLGVGSVEEILSGAFSIRTAPVVAANILAPVIVRLFDAGLAALADPAGTIILAGILQEQVDRVLQAAQTAGFRMRESRQKGDWMALAMCR